MGTLRTTGKGLKDPVVFCHGENFEKDEGRVVDRVT